jgi:hypothetical protein
MMKGLNIQMSINDRLYHLKQLKNDIDAETYRFLVADIIIKYYVELLQTNEVVKNRRYVLKMVNKALKSLGVDEVSYGYVRNFV